MSLHHSEQTHRNLLARLPDVTGRALTDWFHEVDAGPALLRFEERVNWLRPSTTCRTASPPRSSMSTTCAVRAAPSRRTQPEPSDTARPTLTRVGTKPGDNQPATGTPHPRSHVCMHACTHTPARRPGPIPQAGGD